MAKSRLRVTKKYIVNEGLPNEAIYDEVEDAFWVKDEVGRDLEYHVAKWQGRYGIIDVHGGIVVPFAYVQRQILCANGRVIYVAMSAQGDKNTTDIFRATDWKVCLTLGKVHLSIENNLDGKPYIFAYRYQGMNTITFYDLRMDTRPEWSYIGQENGLKYMYSIVEVIKDRDLPERSYKILSANGDAYRISSQLELTSYRDDGFKTKDLGSYIDRNLKIHVIDRYRHPALGSTDIVQNVFLLNCGIHDPCAVSETIYKKYILVLVPEDVQRHNYRIKDYFIYDLTNNSKVDSVLKKIEQYSFCTQC